ncbi:MAG: hypothetical protein IH904_06660 [Proteobacteria bacterium]|nr:hypothetical protein [Pseudomonadota bacterium]
MNEIRVRHDPLLLPMAAPLGLALLIPQTRAKRNISPPDFTYPQHFVDKSGGIAARLDVNTVRAARQRPDPDNRGVHGVRMMKIHASSRITLRAGDLTPFKADFPLRLTSRTEVSRPDRLYRKPGKLLKNSRQCRNRCGAPKIYTSIITSARAFACLYTSVRGSMVLFERPE